MQAWQPTLFVIVTSSWLPAWNSIRGESTWFCQLIEIPCLISARLRVGTGFLYNLDEAIDL